MYSSALHNRVTVKPEFVREVLYALYMPSISNIDSEILSDMNSSCEALMRIGGNDRLRGQFPYFSCSMLKTLEYCRVLARYQGSCTKDITPRFFPNPAWEYKIYHSSLEDRPMVIRVQETDLLFHCIAGQLRVSSDVRPLRPSHSIQHGAEDAAH